MTGRTSGCSSSTGCWICPSRGDLPAPSRAHAPHPRPTGLPQNLPGGDPLSERRPLAAGDEYGLGSVTQEPEGTLLFRWDFAGGDELLRWLLTFGDQAELLEPAELRRELGALAKKISEKYDS